MNVLVIEDDERLSEAISELLTRHNYRVEKVYNGYDGLYYAKSGLYDIVILDVMLPGIDGFNIVKEVRKAKITIPIILLTARSEVGDRVKGLDEGADDYLTKPFYPDELLARLRALLRRPGDVLTDCLEFSDLSLNLKSYKLSCNDRSIQLSNKEFELIKLLISNVGNIISKENIIIKVWGIDSNAEDNNVEVYISFLRKKLKYLKSEVNIATIRKIGYRIEEKND